MREKLLEQITILELAQKEAINSQKYESLVEISQQIIVCMSGLSLCPMQQGCAKASI